MFNIENPKLTGKNPHFSSKFAPLDEVLRVVKAGLPADAVLTQTLVVADDGTQVFRTSCSSEEGGFYVSSDIPFVLGKSDPQGLGSALTYHRRYGLVTLFNLVGQDDDDGEAAQGRGTTKKRSERRPKRTAAKKAAPKTTEGTELVNDDSPADDSNDDW